MFLKYKRIRAFTELQRGLSDPHAHTKRPTVRGGNKPRRFGSLYHFLAFARARSCIGLPPPSPSLFPFFSTRLHLEPLFPCLSGRESFFQRRKKTSGRRYVGSGGPMQRGPCGATSRSSSPSALALALAAFPRAAFAPTVATADFVCRRDGRARRFVHAAFARLVETECAADASSLPAALPTGMGAVPSQKGIGG
jgi:hypothetical protein